MANKWEVLAQEKMNEVASKFFKPERKFIDTPANSITKFAYRQWIYFISAKQVNWLISVGGESPNVYTKRGKKGAFGSFEIDGVSYGWEITEIKGGAAQYKVTLIMK